MDTSFSFSPTFSSTLFSYSLPASSAKLSCSSSLKSSSSYSKLSFVSSTSSVTTMATTFSAATRTDMFEQVRLLITDRFMTILM